MKLIEEAIKEYYGERCQEFAEGCPCCEAWAEYDTIIHLSESVKELGEDRDSWRRVSERLERDSVRQASEMGYLSTQLSDQKEEAAKLREALEFIGGIGFVAPKDASAHHDEAVKVARAALEYIK